MWFVIQKRFGVLPVLATPDNGKSPETKSPNE
jgi:hypothetical protein